MPQYDTSPPSSSKSKSCSHFRTILAGRKCYRMSKDKNEVVWPPHLEAALMEGLEKYAPAESKSPRGLTRFPNRNKFISEYILKTTGEIRTAKQVGSRIQQLRDTSAGKTIMKAISDRHYEMMHPTRSSEGPHDGMCIGIGMSDPSSTMFPPTNQVVHVYISVPPAPAPWPSPAETYAQAPPRQTDVTVLSASMYQWNEPRPLRTINPTVTFKSASPLPLFSSFSVLCAGAVVHIDEPRVMNVHDTTSTSKAPGVGAFLHYTTLCPGYWDTLCNSSDLSPYIIVQEITRQGTDPAQKPTAVMVINYHFSTAIAPPLSPFALNEDDLEVDYETDELLSGLPGHPHTHAHPHAHPHAHALSTCSDSPYPSDRSSSPSNSIPAGFASQPLSPADWTSGSAWAFANANAHVQGGCSSSASAVLSACSDERLSMSMSAVQSCQPHLGASGYYGLAPLQPARSYQYCQ